MLNDPRFRELRAQITIEDDPMFKDEDLTRLGAKVTISLKSGKTVWTVVDHPRGYDSQGRIGWGDLEKKWSGYLKDRDVEGALALAKDLENIEDITLLASRFAGTQY